LYRVVVGQRRHWSERGEKAKNFDHHGYNRGRGETIPRDVGLRWL
jgi:hypothetical protein